jgi:hypothetical protein
MDWEKIKPVLWGAVGGAIVLATVGFNWGGWVTGGAAVAMAKETAATAVAERLGTICVAQFNRDQQKGQKLKEMKDKDVWDKGRYIEKQGNLMGSDFYELTILGGLDRELHHGASSPTIRCGGSVSRYCARQPAAEDLYCGKRLSGLYRTAGTIS